MARSLMKSDGSKSCASILIIVLLMTVMTPLMSSDVQGLVGESIRGTVTNRDTGARIPWVDIYLTNDDDSYTTQTFLTGDYLIFCNPGTYTIETYHEDFYTFSDQVTIDEWEYLDYDIELRPIPPENSRVYGTVRDHDSGEYIEDADVQLESENDTYQVLTDTDGYYEIWCREADYNFRVQKDNYEEYRDDFHVFSNDEREIDVDLEPLGGSSEVYGKVMNKDTGDPIVNVRVRFYGDNYYSEYSDSNGEYRIYCEADNYDVEVYHNDYEDYYDYITVPEDEKMEYDINMEPKPPENSTVYGTVTNSETGEPIQGVQIGFYGDDYYGNSTNESGQFSITCREGEYDLEGWHDDYEDYGDGEIYVSENEDLQYDFDMIPLPPENTTIYGNITNEETGDPVGNADLRFRGDYNSYYFESDENGSYSVKVREGDYDVRSGHNDYETFYDEITVGENETVQYDFQMTPLPPENSTVYGIVTNEETGDPVSGASVRFYGDKKSYYESTDENGNYSVVCREGHYDVQFRHNDYERFYDDIYVERDEVVQYDVEITPLPPENTTIHGNVTDVDTGEPIVEAYIRFYGDHDSYYLESDENGSYSVTCRESSYEVRVDSDDYEDFRDSITVGRDEDVTYDIAMEPFNSTVYGIVTDADTGEPLEDVDIRLDGWDYYFRETTDSNGEFNITCAKGEYRLRADMDGYGRYYERDIYVNDDENIQKNIELKPRNCRIYGNVTNEGTGEPIERAYVNFDGNDDWDHVRTDSQGKYEIMVCSDTYEVHVDVDDYEWFGGVVSVEKASEVQYNIQLTPLPPENSTFTGTITDRETDEPIYGAYIRIDDNQYNDRYTDYSGSDGTFEITCREGNYDLRVSESDYESYYGDIIIQSDEFLEQNFTLISKPPRNSTISGTVTDAVTGDPIKYSDGMLRGDDSHYWIDTNSKGEFEVLCREGDYELEVWGGDHISAYLEVYVGTDESIHLDIQLQPEPPITSTVSGEVVDWETGEPINDAYVRISGENGYFRGYTNSSGMYSIDCSEGYLSIRVNEEPYEYYRSEISVFPNCNYTYNISLINEEPFEESYETCVVSGIVTNTDSGDPVDGVRVRLYGYYNYYTVFTDSDGRYEVTCLQDNYDIRFSKMDYFYFYEEFTTWGYEEFEYNVNLRPYLPDTSFVAGQVVDESTGEPLKGIIVELDGERNFEDFTNSEGRFQIKCSEGYYELEVYQNDNLAFSEEIAIDFEEEITYNISIALREESTCRLYGNVINDETGNPLYHARVYLYGGQDSYSAYTDKNGDYELYCDPGTYNLQVTKSMYKSSTMEIGLTNDEEKEIDFQLIKYPPLNAFVNGTITDQETGEAIGGVEVDIYGYHMDDDYTDHYGQYSIRCREGTYDIRMEKDGYYSYESTITVDYGKDMDYSMELIPEPEWTSSIFGTVTNSESGESLGYIRVRLSGVYDYQSIYTDANGNYSFQCMPGTYIISVYEDYYHDYEDLKVVQDQESLQLNISLDNLLLKESMIYGNVRSNETGELLPLINVQLESEIRSYDTITNRNGEFEIWCIPGVYEIRVYQFTFMSQKGIIDLGTNESIEFNAILDKKPPKDCWFNGTITHADSGSVLGGARIRMTNDDDDSWQYSDYNGRYSIRCRPGIYEVQIWKSGYGRQLAQMSILANSTVTFDVQLTPLGPENSRIFGTVIHKTTGDPLALVRVEARNIDRTYYSNTNEEGEFEINCREGTYEISVTLITYKDHFEILTIGESDHVQITFKLYNTSECDAVVQGVVKEEYDDRGGGGRGGGDRIPGALVELIGENGETMFQTVTNQFGYYTLECDSGDYTLRITAEHFFPLEQSITILRGSNDLDLFLTPDPPMGRIYGTVTCNLTHESLSDAQLLFYHQLTEEEYEIFCDSNGSYDVILPTGEFELTIQSEGYQEFTTQFGLSKDEELQMDQVLDQMPLKDLVLTISAPNQVLPLDTYTVVITVTTAGTGKNVNNVAIQLSINQAGTLDQISGSTNSRGEFFVIVNAHDISIDTLSTITIQASKEGYSDIEDSISILVKPEIFIHDYGVKLQGDVYGEVDPGETIVLTVYVKNTGDWDNTISLSLTDGNVSWAILTKDEVDLIPLETKIVSLQITVPDSATAGLSYLELTATSQGDANETDVHTVTLLVNEPAGDGGSGDKDDEWYEEVVNEPMYAGGIVAIAILVVLMLSLVSRKQKNSYIDWDWGEGSEEVEQETANQRDKEDNIE